jgi:hypothetical protein
MISRVHQAHDVRPIADFKFIEAAHVLPNAPERIVWQSQSDAEDHMTGHTVGHEDEGFTEMVLAQIGKQFLDPHADLPH